MRASARAPASDGYTPGNDTGGPVTAEQERAAHSGKSLCPGLRRKAARPSRRSSPPSATPRRRLAESLAVLRPEPANALALLLAETVDRLVRQVVGEVDIDANLLLARANAAAQLVGKDVEPTRLRAHPEDIVYLEAARLEVPLHADPTLTRGAIVLETGHGWIEDGPAVRLDRLRAELDKMVAAR